MLGQAVRTNQNQYTSSNDTPCLRLEVETLLPAEQQCPFSQNILEVAFQGKVKAMKVKVVG